MKAPYTKTRKKLAGYSASEFKTLLKRAGFRVPRDVKTHWVVTKKNRRYRFRWWSDLGFEVDISEPIADFDRWANSVEQVVWFTNLFPAKSIRYKTRDYKRHRQC
jgi:hypothetical protein